MFATRRALVDGRDFVGWHLRTQMHFDLDVTRSDVVRLLDESFELVVCVTAAPDGRHEPEVQQQHFTAVARTLARVRTRHLVLVSSTDVYGAEDGLDESSPVGVGGVSEAGLVRAWFEQAVREYHPSTVVVRLPELIGPQLVQGLLVDLALGECDRHRSLLDTFQFHDVSRLGADLQTSLDAGLLVANLVSEPVAVGDVLDVFGGGMPAADVPLAGTPYPSVVHDVRTRHAGVFGSTGSYVTSRAEVIDSITRWWDSLLAASFAGGRAS